jgi:serine palmitoyltransferase
MDSALNFVDRGSLEAAAIHFTKLMTRTEKLLTQIPGSTIVFRYIRNSYQNDPIRVVLEFFLCFFALKYLLSSRYKPGNNATKLTSREIDELIDEWVPEPLVPGDDDQMILQQDLDELAQIPSLVSAQGPKVKIAGDPNKTLTSLSSYDVYALANSDKIKDKAVLALRKYGVGACNPPGFYGTMDVHMQLEKDIASFLGTEQAVLYAQGFSAVSSIVPAFAKRGDLLVMDDGCSFALQKGAQISRAKIVLFKHNDVDDLEHKLASIAAEDARLKRPLYRKFILAEGLYGNYGDIAPLPKLIALKLQYKYRLIMDETFSFGILGANGRGVAEHWGMLPRDIDILVGSLCHAIAASGGFCAASTPICEHQRLSSQAYVFSAALPPMLAVAASEAIYHLKDKSPGLTANLRTHAKLLRESLAQLPYLELSSAPESPLQHIRLRGEALPFRLTGTIETAEESSSSSPRLLSLLSGGGMKKNSISNSARVAAFQRSNSKLDPDTAIFEAEGRLLQAVVEESTHQGVLITRAKYNLEQELNPPRPSLKIIVSAELSRRDMESAARIIKASFVKVVGSWTKARK